MGYQRVIPEKSEARSNNPDAARISGSLPPDYDAIHLKHRGSIQAALRLLGSPSSPIGIQKKCGCGTCPECAEEDESILRKPQDSTSRWLIQRQGKQGKEQGTAETALPALIVEDDTEKVGPGQMRKSEFLGELHESLCAAADESLKGTIWSTMGCPYVDRWFSHYRSQSSQHLERALRKYAPETAGVSAAGEYIPIVTQRVRRGVEQWRETGEVSGVPAELAQGGMAGPSAGELIGGLLGGALSAVGGMVSSVVSGVGAAISGVGGALFKGREGGANEGADAGSIVSELGGGEALDGGVRSGMETAFGASFSGLRIHRGAKAAELSAGMNARAFTIGNDVAFGAGEYQPGTLVGDALIAHELAHVTQQGGASASAATSSKIGTDYGSLEKDADLSAVGAVAKLWGGEVGSLAEIGRRASPRLRSGLRLSKCGGDEAQKAGPQAGGAQQKPTLMIDAPELRTVMADMWKRSIAGGVVVQEHSIVVVRNTKTGKITKVDSWAGKEARPGEMVSTNICLHSNIKLGPDEEVWGSIHTHPLSSSEGIQEPNPIDKGVVKKILADRAATVRCGTQHFVIAHDNNIYQYDGNSHWVVGERKAKIGL